MIKVNVIFHFGQNMLVMKFQTQLENIKKKLFFPISF